MSPRRLAMKHAAAIPSEGENLVGTSAMGGQEEGKIRASRLDSSAQMAMDILSAKRRHQIPQQASVLSGVASGHPARRQVNFHEDEEGSARRQKGPLTIRAARMDSDMVMAAAIAAQQGKKLQPSATAVHGRRSSRLRQESGPRDLTEEA